MATTALPRPQAAFVDGGGRPTREFYDFLRLLQPIVGLDTELGQQIAAIIVRLEALENDSDDALILGLLTVKVTGNLASGVVQLTLQNDEAEPGNNQYYGTDSTGAQGGALGVTFGAVLSRLSLRC